MELFISKLEFHIQSEWEIDEKLESKSGAFGVVYFARKTNGIICGEKVVNEGDLCVYKKIKIKDFVLIEPRILEILSNSCIHSIKYYGCAKDDKHIYIYMEYYRDVISLNDLLLKRVTMNGEKINEELIFKLFEKIVLVLKDLHEKNIIHRDIKGEHILFIVENGEFNGDVDKIKGVKFIDFGVSKLVSEKDGSKYFSYTGTEAYIAPEVKLRNNTACRKSDVYSLGCVLIKMAGGDLNEKGGTPVPPLNISNRLKNIIQRCTVVNIDARLDSASLFNLLNNEVKTLTFKKYDLEGLKTIDQSCGEDVELTLPNEILLDNSIPDGIKGVKFVSFNKEVECDAIPLSVTYLDTGYEFDIEENGENLPNDSIKTLRCGFNFTIPINPRTLPRSITDLQLPKYNLEIKKNTIPSSVSYLTLGDNFNHFESLSNLPLSIICLEFGTKKFDKNSLIDESSINNLITKYLPSSVSSLVINGVQVNIPIPLPSFKK